MVEEKVREGYKRTEVGVIPEDWEVRKIGELFSFLRTGNNSRKDLNQNGEYNYIHYGDIHTKWDIKLDCNKSRMPFINKSRVKKLPIIEDGDIIMADASEDYEGIGKSIEIKNVGNKKIVSGLHTFLLRGNKDIVIDGFKCYLQFMYPVKEGLRKIATGISVYGISKERVRGISVPLPPLKEQKAIAEVLSDTDNLITSLQKLINKKEKIKKGAMQKLLTGEQRLPGFSGEWEEKELGDICLVKKGRMITKRAVRNGKIPVIAGGKEPAYFHNEANRVGKTITISASGANAGYVSFHKNPIFASDCSTISEDNSYSIDFIYYFLKLNQLKIYNAQTGGAQPHIHPKDIKPLTIKIPQLEEQKAIAQILSDMDSEIEALNKKLEKYKKIKQGMMEELLTGRIRLV